MDARRRALLLSPGAPRGDERRSGGNSTLELSDDFDRTADCKPKIAVRATLVDCDFSNPFEFSYQKGAPGGPSPKVLARSSTRPAAASWAFGRQRRRLKPVMALPKWST